MSLQNNEDDNSHMHSTTHVGIMHSTTQQWHPKPDELEKLDDEIDFQEFGAQSSDSEEGSSDEESFFPYNPTLQDAARLTNSSIIQYGHAKPLQKRRIAQMVKLVADNMEQYESRYTLEESRGRDLRSENMTAICLVSNDCLVAFAAFYNEDPQTYLLYELHVQKEWRGRRLGQALLDAVHIHAQAAGATAVSLYVHTANSDAIRFYTRNGYISIPGIDLKGMRKTKGPILLPTRMLKILPRQSRSPQAATRSQVVHLTSGASCSHVVPATACVLTVPAANCSGKEQYRQQRHLEQIDANGLAWFKCQCANAKQRGRTSCLHQFNQEELTEAHSELYQSLGDRSKPIGKRELLRNTHRLVWALREVARNTTDGSKFQVRKWIIGGKIVCKAAWQCAYGMTDNMLRAALSMVRRGHSPVNADSGADAAYNARLLDKLEGATGHIKAAEKRGVAVSWWKRYLMICDFMPNEHKIVIRGPSYRILHEKLYAPEAKRLGLHLAYKGFMKCAKIALNALSEELPGAIEGRLLMGRSARHSGFPECSRCQELRKAYIAAASARGASKDEIDRAYKDLLDHHSEWAGDRNCALQARRDSFLSDSDTCYQCDDKCGSFWCELPVDPTGRHAKDTAKAVYRFAVQANVVCGVGGVMRFCIVPKNIGTGGSFGLTNLTMAIWRAFEIGRLKPNVTRLLRHTDGGSDNVTHVTHIFHWLLVYLGIFQEVIWFRFEPGHSHTEIADRLFSLMKRTFQTDSSARVTGVGSFADLEKKLRQTFAQCPEDFFMEYNFANWDFNDWFQGTSASIDAADLFDGNFARYSFDNVFRYLYVGDTLAEHGGVKVMYKQRLSARGSRVEAEWAPVERRRVNNEECNVTTDKGVLFIPRPPDLRREPKREPFADDKEGKPADGCSAIINKRRRADLTPANVHDWMVLQKAHTDWVHSGAIPNLPSSVTVTGDSESQGQGLLEDGKSVTTKFTGTPAKLLPILKSLRRFERPLITWDPFVDAPPATFTSVPTAATASEGGDKAAEGSKPVDPIVRNHVTHKGYSKSSHQKDMQRQNASDWAHEQDSRLEVTECDKLYIVRFEYPDGRGDGELKVGLILSGDTAVNEDGDKGRLCKWFGRSTSSQLWPSTVQFKKWGDTYEFVSYESFLLEVHQSDLTLGSQKNWRTAPALKSAFTARLKTFAEHESLRVATRPAKPVPSTGQKANKKPKHAPCKK